MKKFLIENFKGNVGKTLANFIVRHPNLHITDFVVESNGMVITAERVNEAEAQAQPAQANASAQPQQAQQNAGNPQQNANQAQGANQVLDPKDPNVQKQVGFIQENIKKFINFLLGQIGKITDDTQMAKKIIVDICNIFKDSEDVMGAFQDIIKYLKDIQGKAQQAEKQQAQQQPQQDAQAQAAVAESINTIINEMFNYAESLTSDSFAPMMTEAELSEQLNEKYSMIPEEVCDKIAERTIEYGDREINEDIADQVYSQAKGNLAGLKALGQNAANWAVKKTTGKDLGIGGQSAGGARNTVRFAQLFQQHLKRMTDLKAKIEKYSTTTKDPEEQKKAQGMVKQLGEFITIAQDEINRTKEEIKQNGWDRTAGNQNGDQGQQGQSNQQQGQNQNGQEQQKTDANKDQKQDDKGQQGNNDNNKTDDKNAGNDNQNQKDQKQDDKQEANESVTLTIGQLKKLINEGGSWEPNVYELVDTIIDQGIPNSEVETWLEDQGVTDPETIKDVFMELGSRDMEDAIGESLEVVDDEVPNFVYHVYDIKWDSSDWDEEDEIASGKPYLYQPEELYIGSYEEMTELDIEDWLEEHYMPVAYGEGSPFKYDKVDPNKIDPELIEEGLWGSIKNAAKSFGKAIGGAAVNAYNTAKGAGQEIAAGVKDRVDNLKAGNGFSRTENCAVFAEDLARIIGGLEMDMKDMGWSAKRNPKLAQVLNNLETSMNQIHGKGEQGMATNLDKIMHGGAKLGWGMVKAMAVGMMIKALTPWMRAFMGPRAHAAVIAAMTVLANAAIRNLNNADVNADKKEEKAAAKQQQAQQANESKKKL